MICPYAKIPPSARKAVHRAAIWKPADRAVRLSMQQTWYTVGLHETRRFFRLLEARP